MAGGFPKFLLLPGCCGLRGQLLAEYVSLAAVWRDGSKGTVTLRPPACPEPAAGSTLPELPGAQCWWPLPPPGPQASYARRSSEHLWRTHTHTHTKATLKPKMNTKPLPRPSKVAAESGHRTPFPKAAGCSTSRTRSRYGLWGGGDQLLCGILFGQADHREWYTA